MLDVFNSPEISDTEMSTLLQEIGYLLDKSFEIAITVATFYIDDEIRMLVVENGNLV